MKKDRKTKTYSLSSKTLMLIDELARQECRKKSTIIELAIKLYAERKENEKNN